MIALEIKEKVLDLLDSMPAEDSQKVLDFAFQLQDKQKQTEPRSTDAWEAALANAEKFWFSLPISTRKQYSGQVVAIANNQIIDTAKHISELRRRVAMKYRNQPVLFIDADAEQEPALFVRSPRLR